MGVQQTENDALAALQPDLLRRIAEAAIFPKTADARSQAARCPPTSAKPTTATPTPSDVNDLALACHPNHKLAEQGWTTRKRTDGGPRYDV